MLDDSQLISVTFACCDHKGFHELGRLRNSALGFYCPVCGTGVKANPLEFVQLLNQDPADSVHEITFRPIE